MKICVIGSGLMGGALGTSWARSGHSITFTYSRDFAKLEKLAREAGNGARAAQPSDAVQQADVALISVPWHRLDDALAQAGPLTNKTVISCMIPMLDNDSDLALGFDTSGAEDLARRTGAHVVGTFNTIWSDVIVARMNGGDPRPSLFYVGDDDAAKQSAARLIHDAGFDPVDAGELRNARLLEPFGLLMGKLGFAINPLVAYRFLKP